jgi:HAD superfamily hydrolase (TIGR01509 family)
MAPKPAHRPDAIPPPAALLWDVDGTLADTELEGHRPAFNAAFRDAGLPWHWDPPTYRRLLSVTGGRERLAAFLEAETGLPSSPELLDTLVSHKQAHYTRFVAEGRVSLRPGVARLIEEARRAGLIQGIVTTSGRAAVEALLEGVLGELGEAFRFRICGEDVSRKKPDPEAYRLARQRLALPAAAVLAIEDSPQGLAAATAAGVPCLVTLREPVSGPLPGGFSAARAVLDGLGEAASPPRVLLGPPCADGPVTLTYLRTLLAER